MIFIIADAISEIHVHEQDKMRAVDYFQSPWTQAVKGYTDSDEYRLNKIFVRGMHSTLIRINDGVDCKAKVILYKIGPILCQ